VLQVVVTIRRLDALGRFVVPIEVRRALGLQPGSPLEISLVDGTTVVLRRPRAVCALCGEEATRLLSNGQSMCERCCRDAAEALAP
jgi:transcriptional pleiotropic regulator of transition state genes